MRAAAVPVLLVFLITAGIGARGHSEDAAQQAAQDARIVETLLRLRNIDVNERPRLKQAALRHLEQYRGSPKYLELVRRLKLRGVEDELERLALSDPTGNLGVNAAETLLDRGESARFARLLGAGDAETSVGAATVLGLVGSAEAAAMLRPLVTDQRLTRDVRQAAASGLGRAPQGQRWLLDCVAEGRLPDDLQYTVANLVFASRVEEIRARAAQLLELPETADKTPLPPLASLVSMPGDPAQGARYFNTKSECIKCHRVRGEGKEVGPDLSEIGSKLSPEAAFVAILDPSAGISHNYETYQALLTNGRMVTGLMIDRTDDSVTLRGAEGIDRSIAATEIDELTKSEVSLMPADLQRTMSVQELVDLVAYLGTLQRLRPQPE